MHTRGLSLLLIVFAGIAVNGAPLQRRDPANEANTLDSRALGKAKPAIPKPVPVPPKPPVVSPPKAPVAQPKPPVAPPKVTPPAPPKATVAQPPKTTAAPPPPPTVTPPAKTTALTTSKSTTSAASTSSSQAAAPACPVRKPAAAPPVAKPVVGRAKTKPALLCGVPLRTAAAGSCKGKKRFTFSGGLLKPLNSRAGSDDEFVPDSADELDDDHEFDDDIIEETDGTEQCDHVLELQVLKKTLEANGACKALDAIVSAGKLTAAERATVVNPLVDAVNDKNNLFFLDATLNRVKANEVNRGLGAAGGKLFDKTDLDEVAQFKAVDGYLATQLTASKKLASDLDVATKKMINDAAALANTNIPCSGLSQTQQTQATAKVKAAQTGFKGTASVATAWNNVLTFVNNQAA